MGGSAINTISMRNMKKRKSQTKKAPNSPNSVRNKLTWNKAENIIAYPVITDKSQHDQIDISSLLQVFPLMLKF